MPAGGNFAAFNQFLATYSTLDFTRSPLAGKGTWCLLHTTSSMLLTATKHFDRAESGFITPGMVHGLGPSEWTIEWHGSIRVVHVLDPSCWSMVHHGGPWTGFIRLINGLSPSQWSMDCRVHQSGLDPWTKSIKEFHGMCPSGSGLGHLSLSNNTVI